MHMYHAQHPHENAHLPSPLLHPPILGIHPYLLAIGVLVATADCLSYRFYTAASGKMVTIALIVHVALCLLIAGAPRSSSILLMLEHLLLYCLQLPIFPMQTLATLMALAVMSYTFPIIASATVNIAFIACNWILHFFAVTITYGIGFHISVYTGGDLQFPVDPFAQFILAATIGYLCKINKRSTLDKAHHIQEETRLQTQLLSQQRNLRLASHLHDEVANGIAAIAAIAHAQDDPQWRDVARKADATFDASHELIRLLYTPDDHTAQDQAPSWESIVAEERNRLRAQGVDGYCDVAVGDAASQLTADQTAELIGLIREVFTNIGKHGKIAETGYVFRLFAQGNRIELVAMNDAADSPNPHARGHGLLLHDSILSDMGGTLTTTLDDGTWIVHAVMPLPTNRR